MSTFGMAEKSSKRRLSFCRKFTSITSLKLIGVRYPSLRGGSCVPSGNANKAISWHSVHVITKRPSMSVIPARGLVTHYQRLLVLDSVRTSVAPPLFSGD